MSRRFGRNQRRAARERIAELEAKLVTETFYLAKQLKRRQNAEAALQEVILSVGAALGKNFVGLPPMDVILTAQQAASLDSDHGFYWTMPTGDIATMFPVEVKIDPDVYRSRMHIRMTLGGARAGYAISERALARGTIDGIADTISRELAVAIVTEFRKLRAVR